MNPSDPTSADPAATFTCLGAPDSSVKAVLGEVSLSPTMWRSNEDGTIKNVECEGWIRYAGDRVNGEVLTDETLTVVDDSTRLRAGWRPSIRCCARPMPCMEPNSFSICDGNSNVENRMPWPADMGATARWAWRLQIPLDPMGRCRGSSNSRSLTFRGRVRVRRVRPGGLIMTSGAWITQPGRLIAGGRRVAHAPGWTPTITSTSTRSGVILHINRSSTAGSPTAAFLQRVC